jgi:hypothetical protein
MAPQFDLYLKPAGSIAEFPANASVDFARHFPDLTPANRPHTLLSLHCALII